MQNRDEITQGKALPKRKNTRAKNFDYSKNGAYFITICTHEKKHIFAMGTNFINDNDTEPVFTNNYNTEPVGVDSISARIAKPVFTDENKSQPVGADSISARVIEQSLIDVINQHPNIYLDKYIIMPNHIHMIIMINRADMESAPTISDVIQSFKRYSTIKYINFVKQGILPKFNKKIWQRSFHDRIIRDESEYQLIWKYIDENMAKWELDCFFSEGL